MRILLPVNCRTRLYIVCVFCFYVCLVLFFYLFICFTDLVVFFYVSRTNKSDCLLDLLCRYAWYKYLAYLQVRWGMILCSIISWFFLRLWAVSYNFSIFRPIKITFSYYPSLIFNSRAAIIFLFLKTKVLLFSFNCSIFFPFCFVFGFVIFVAFLIVILVDFVAVFYSIIHILVLLWIMFHCVS